MTPDELIEEHHPATVERAQRLALYFGVDTHDAISAAQEALRKAAHHFKPKGTAKFATYAATCVKNALLDLAKKERLHAKLFIDADNGQLETFTSFLDAQPGNEPPPMQDAALRETGRILRAVVDRLQEDDRCIIELAWEGETGSEIARRQRCSKQNISSRLSNIYGQIRVLLSDQGFGGLDTVGLLKTVTIQK